MELPTLSLSDIGRALVRFPDTGQWWAFNAITVVVPYYLVTFTLPFELRGRLPEGSPVSGVRRMGGGSGSGIQRSVLPGTAARAESPGQGGAGDLPRRPLFPSW